MITKRESLMQLTKENIVSLLDTNDRAIGRALLVLHNNQTSDEQASQDTKYHNKKGFRPCHAYMGSSMAEWFKKKGYLSPKQANYWRKLDKKGNMRIGIYWKQLIEAAEAKAQAA